MQLTRINHTGYIHISLSASRQARLLIHAHCTAYDADARKSLRVITTLIKIIIRISCYV